MTTKEKASTPVVRRPIGFTDQLVEPFNRLRSDIDRLFEGFPTRLPLAQFGRLDTAMTVPAMEMKETEEAFKLSVEVPGMDAKDVEVTIDNGALVIKGEKKAEREENEKGYYYSERSYGSFERRIELPPSANAEAITAKAKDGVLQVAIAKNPAVENSTRRIAIEG